MMKTSAEWKAAAHSWLKIFLSAVIASFLSLLVSTGDFPTDLNSLKAILVSGLVAVLPVIKNMLDGKDPRYGKGYIAE